ncbi:MAG: hypothetical protein RMJ88_07415 [Thermogemmata sp.]|nr:hypothetical protein [Thermogemmata sp.]
MVEEYGQGVGAVRAAVADIPPNRSLSQPCPDAAVPIEIVCLLPDFRQILADHVKCISALSEPPVPVF